MNARNNHKNYAQSLRELADWLDAHELPENGNPFSVSVNTDSIGPDVTFHTGDSAGLVMNILGGEWTHLAVNDDPGSENAPFVSSTRIDRLFGMRVLVYS